MFRITTIVIIWLVRHNHAQNLASPNGTTSIDDILAILRNNTIDTNGAQICQPPGRCVQHYQCLEDGTFNRRGVNIVNVRFSDDDSNTIVDGNEMYQVSTNGTIMQRNGVEANVCGYLKVCCGIPTKDKIELPPRNITGCGYSNPDGIFFKINNTDKAQYGEFPWMVAVLSNQPSQNTPVLVGGGSLIHPSVILTAAHILGEKTPHEFKVRAGEWDTQTDNEHLPHQERTVNKIIRHEDYDSFGLLNDYALLIVDQPFVLGANIQPICLPKSNLMFDDEPNCYSAGWGTDNFLHSTRRQTIMKKVKLTVVSFETCQNQLRQTQLGDIFELHESFTCAAGSASGDDTCTGDGGSPLICPVYNQKNRYYQTGIVAWGLECGKKNVPGVYANVGSVREWINRVMILNGFGTDSYMIK